MCGCLNGNELKLKKANFFLAIEAVNEIVE